MYLPRLEGERFNGHNTQYPYFNFNHGALGTEHLAITSALSMVQRYSGADALLANLCSASYLLCAG